eukprot:4211118-Pleurochrysis_carterae.AAC.3
MPFRIPSPELALSCYMHSSCPGYVPRFGAGLGLPIGRRDAVLHGYGVDALSDGLILVIAKSANAKEFSEIEFPPLQGFGAARMQIHALQE